MLNRTIYSNILKKLNDYKKMVFISGPRQSGKTTFIKSFSQDFVNKVYFNWDILEDKKRILESPYFFENINRIDDSRPLIILDEIHKYEAWKNYLKGVYDKHNNSYNFIVLGSGRLDIYRKGGDSLAGRYLMFNFFPFTLSELANKRCDIDNFLNNLFDREKESTEISSIWESLSKTSGFPDPYISQKEEFFRIWSRNYLYQIIREDIRDLAGIKNINNIELLFSLLPSKIGSPLSLNSIAKNMNVSFDSVKSWLKIFETYFLTFSISPWSDKIARAINKEKKIYLYNFVLIEQESIRYENMVALELWRAITNWNNLGLGNFSLHYVRNKEKEEVDFLVVKNNKPAFLIEAKTSDTNISKSLYKFQNMLKVPAIQLVNKPNIYKLISNENHKIFITSAEPWLVRLP